jgi:flagellar L-ring protein precursor FlgH
MKKNIVLIVLILAWGPGLLLANSLYPQYPQAGDGSIYTEVRAHRVGDLITILIEETNAATNAASSNTQKNANVAVGAGFGIWGQSNFIPTNTNNELGVGGEDYNAGQGTSNQSTTVTGEMTAKITEVLPDGNFLIHGTRDVEVNKDIQLMQVTGEIRPQDIGADNTILSSRIANARIIITGKGPDAEVAQPGILTRIFSWLGLF